jgi:hypothetical protein
MPPTAIAQARSALVWWWSSDGCGTLHFSHFKPTLSTKTARDQAGAAGLRPEAMMADEE